MCFYAEGRKEGLCGYLSFLMEEGLESANSSIDELYAPYVFCTL